MKIDLSSKAASTIKNKTGGWRTYVPKTNLETCIGCGTCSRVCPENAIKMNGKQPVTDLNYCKGCGVCAEECPVKAIKMEIEKK